MKRARGCDYLWDKAEADLVHELMGQGLGHECPGGTGGKCPLAPKSLDVVPMARTEGLLVAQSEGKP